MHFHSALKTVMKVLQVCEIGVDEIVDYFVAFSDLEVQQNVRFVAVSAIF